MKKILIFSFIVISIIISSCSNSKIEVAQSLDNIDVSGSENGVVVIPEEVPVVVRNLFAKYTRVVAPNGRPIHLLAQSAWEDDQIVKARNVLQHYLTDFPGSEYGNNKASVANSMANRNATMILFENSEALENALSGPLRRFDLSMQDLRANECPWEGSADYMNQITRDASYEEIWHLVHDNGIKQILPEMIAEMKLANDSAALAGWNAYPEDEPQEHPNEYVSVLIDNYFDLWAVKPKLYEGREITDEQLPDNHSHFGRYFATTREKLKNMDPAGYSLLTKFFHPHWTYTAILPIDFEDCFSLKFDESMPYTWKSQHLKNVSLSGENNVDLIGNNLDNIFTGNAGNNKFTGEGGNDILNGMEGHDIAIYAGVRKDYTIKTEEDKVFVEDKNGEIDTLINIENIQFEDQNLSLETNIK
jgi:hypothetical protein